jgi:hydrogenase maturation protease
MKKTVVVGIGNEIMGDDGVGIVAVREAQRLFPDLADYIEAPVGGLQLIESLSGYQRAILIDSVEGETAGKIHRLSADEAFAQPKLASPHDIDFGTALALAKELNLPIPEDIIVLAVEVKNAHTFGERLSDEIKAAMNELLIQIAALLKDF